MFRALKMKYLAPRATPALSQLLPDLGNPSPREIARFLDVTERTVFRWHAADKAPRAAMLALFWESSYGLSALNAELHNAALVHKSHADSLARHVVNLERRIARLEKIGDFGSSNVPYLAPVGRAISAF